MVVTTRQYKKHGISQWWKIPPATERIMRNVDGTATTSQSNDKLDN